MTTDFPYSLVQKAVIARPGGSLVAKRRGAAGFSADSWRAPGPGNL